MARLFDPYVPTPPGLVRAKLEMGEATSRDVVFDLGCGDGRVLIAAARKYGARGVGVELQQGVVEEAWSRVADHDLEEKITILCQDFMETDLSEATLVILYLTERTLHALSDKLQQLPVGARVVTHQFPLAGWKHSEQGSWTSSQGEVVPLFLYLKR